MKTRLIIKEWLFDLLVIMAFAVIIFGVVIINYFVWGQQNIHVVEQGAWCIGFFVVACMIISTGFTLYKRLSQKDKE